MRRGTFTLQIPITIAFAASMDRLALSLRWQGLERWDTTAMVGWRRWR